MAHLNTDIVEEDAADLQFPKDWTSSNVYFEQEKMPVERKKIFTLESKCYICRCFIFEPYICCGICKDVLLCITCFATGKEKLDHKNDHNYMIIKNNFPLIEVSGWSAKEEKNLLTLIEEYGFGNWVDIALRLPGRSAEDCRKHYLQYYIDNQWLSGLPKIEENTTNLCSIDFIPYTFELNKIENPPRFMPGSLNYGLMAGYNAARSDFDIHFDNHAELLVSNLKYDEFVSSESFDKLGQELQLAVVNAYNFRLKKRMKRRKIVRDHGLISSRKTLSFLQRYDSTVTKFLMERLRIFTQLLSAVEFDSIIECLHNIGELKNYLQELFNFRKNGIKKLHSTVIFRKLSKLRQEYDKDKKFYINNFKFNWKNVTTSAPNENFVSTTLSRRRIAPPLDIHPGMVGYEKLLSAERSLCARIRILPDVYMHFKHLLINENKKNGSVKLAQARNMLKIDVNKTKMIHEFLSNEGYINID